MDVLVLSPQADLLLPTIWDSGDKAYIPLRQVVSGMRSDEDRNVAPHDCLPDDWPKADYVVLFNYRHIVPQRVIDKYSGNIINIHTSVLPFNRGAHPNFWSWFDSTPKGVSIHRVNEKIDDGELLACVEIHEGWFNPPKTLLSTRTDLIIIAAGLFKRKWRGGKGIVGSKDLTKYQGKNPSYHKEKDIEPFFKHLSNKWDTPVYEVERLGFLYRGNSCIDLK